MLGDGDRSTHTNQDIIREFNMRFPINVLKQNRCPICKKLGPGTKSPVTPRPEVVSLSFNVMSFVHGRSYPVFLGSHLMLGWDSGVCKHPQSRSSLGATFFVAKKDGRTPDVGEMEIQFCSVACMRQFLMDAVDELERRIEKVTPEVDAVKEASKTPVANKAVNGSRRSRRS